MEGGVEQPRKRRRKEEKAPPPTTNPKGECDEWMARKQRFCNFPRKAGSTYCGHHSKEGRVPCPVNPNHSIPAKDVESHVAVCPDRHMLPPEKEPYYSKACNAAGGEPSTLPALSDEERGAVREAVREAVRRFELPQPLPSEYLTWPPGGEADAPGPRPTRGAKHTEQIASLLGHLHRIGCLPITGSGNTVSRRSGGEHEKSTAVASSGDTLTYLEFGAGKGSLALGVARVLFGDESSPDTQRAAELPSETRSRVLLVDRSNFRRKCIHPFFEWIRVDLRDLDLGKVPAVVALPRVVGFSKHLCGVATDYTLRCCVRARDAIRCVAIALCCHQRCVYEDYVNPSYLAKAGITSPHHFAELKSMSSWAVGASDEQEDTAEEREEKKAKRELGWKAKRLLDDGRVEYMQQNGFTVRLVRYIDEAHTPENVLLLCIRERA